MRCTYSVLGRAKWRGRQEWTMEVLAATAALAVAGSPSLWAISMADMGATSTGIDSFLPAIQSSIHISLSLTGKLPQNKRLLYPGL